ncbi:MAG: biotin--[acetyl-CoA-carboxylase] ligase [Alcanivoracaceae bacterium]|nr:biotin--[acetyl-CoA-carboxylase] ligase [Alcanivoracaceae bacterium]
MDSELIQALADGEFHSGETLGNVLGISRAAVWKRIEQLASVGVDVERVRGRGYRIPGGVSLLERSRLQQGLASIMSVDVLQSTDSTNAEVMRRLAVNSPAPLAILAEHQSAGRGRRGRSWSSPYAGNIYLSVGWRFPVGAPRLEGLSLAVGVVVAEALSANGLAGRVALKWPNDIWVHGRKIGGILIELSGDLEDACSAVVGIGINGRLGSGAAQSIDQPWTDIYTELGDMPDRSALAIDLLKRLYDMMSGFPLDGFGSWMARWAALDALAGQSVQVVTASGAVSGTATGVDSSGALRLCTDGGAEMLFHGGEASLRPASMGIKGKE